MGDLCKIKPLVWDVGTDGALYSDCGAYKVSPGQTGVWLSSAIPFAGFPDAASAKAATEEMDARFLANRLEPVPEVVTALRKMHDRCQLYCGGPDLPHAGQSDRALMEEARAALAQVEKADG